MGSKQYRKFKYSISFSELLKYVFLYLVKNSEICSLARQVYSLQ